MSNTNTYEPDYAVVPGETLQETIDALGLSQKELAERTGLTTKTIYLMIKGEAPITAETALLLERVTGVAAVFWSNLESKYRERLARIQARQQMEKQRQWVKRFSYGEMVKLKFVEAAADEVDRVDNLIRFFGVASSQQWEETYSQLAGAAREPAKFANDLGDLSAWLRAGEIKAQRCECGEYDKTRFETALAKIRSLTQQAAPLIWSEVVTLCAQAGVAVVLVPPLPKTHLYGFTRWLTPRKALIQLSLRYKTDDILWFTFFHEAAHILMHGKKDVFLEYRGAASAKEDEANRWAADFLIPHTAWREFMGQSRQPINECDIVVFAKRQGIAPSTVLGRLQSHEKDGVSHAKFNHLKQKLEIVWEGL